MGRKNKKWIGSPKDEHVKFNEKCNLEISKLDTR